MINVASGDADKVGWRIAEWHRAAGVSRSYTYSLLKGGVIASVKSGKARIIVTPPAEFLASLPSC